MEDIDILLLPQGDEGSGFRTQNVGNQRARRVLVDRGDTLVARSSIVTIDHGTLTPDNEETNELGEPATLLVFEFRFICHKQSRRFCNAKITLTFDDASGNTRNQPEIHRMWPEGAFALNKKTTTRNVKHTVSGGLSAGNSPITAGNLGYEWQMEAPQDQVHYTSLRGIKRMFDKNMGLFSHEALLESCLDYLDLVLPQLKKASSHNSLAPELGLLRYVTLCWPRHCQEDESDKSVIRAFQFLSREKDCGVWIMWYNKLERNGNPIPEAEQTPLQIACRFGLVGLVKHCIPITKVAENAQPIMDGAIEIAARYGYEEIIKVLLSHSAVASPIALSLAVRTGSESCVTEIINAGVNVDQEDKKSYSPLHYSVLAGFPGITALLLANGATIDKAGPDGATALHLAAMTGHNVMVEGLLKSNATINLPDASGYDALKAAARAGSSGIVRLLIEAGANPHTFANDGNNALHVALEAGDLAVISIILDRTQDVTSCNQAGYRPLDLAAQQGNLHILQELIQRLGNPSVDNIMQYGDESTEDTWRFPEDSRLPLLAISARHGHRDIIKWFLQSSNRIGREAGSWAIYEAAAGGHVEVLEELLPRGESEKWPVALDQMGQTPLHMAAKRGNRAALEGLLEYHQFHVDMTDGRKWTALHQAAASGNNSIIDLLIENGATIAYADCEEKTPLHIAAQQGQLKVLQQLLTVMSEVDVMDSKGETPFSLAVEQGHTEIVSYLYETHDITKDLGYHKPVLHRAALYGHNDLVRLFIDYKWDVNSRAIFGQTPLHFTAHNDHLEVASTLIDAGADFNTVDEFGRTPLYHAASHNSPNVAQRLLKAGANPNPLDNEDDTPLYQAAYRGNLEVVKVLLSELLHEGLNLQCSGGWTALHAAYDSPEIVKTLLAAGANPFILDSYSKTSLALAFENSYEETCNELISAMEKQALQDVNLQMAAIHEIAAVGNIQALDRLFVSGVDFDIRGEDGATALHHACRNGQKETVEMLIQRGADIQRVSSRWGAPITAASAGGSAEIVELLLSKGVKINSVNEEDDTALTLALAMGHTEIARLLLKNGANLNHMGRKHGSALKIAIERENLDFVKLLLENGANFAIDTPGSPPLLHVAAQINNRDIMEALVEAGMNDLAVRDSAGRSLLIVAIFNKAQQIVDFLLEHRELNLDVQDGAGRTALIIAAAQGSHVVTELLLRKANPDIPDMEGKTALIHSILSEDIQTIQELLQHQASLAVSDVRGHNPLYWACLTDNTEVFEVILQAAQDSESLISLSEYALQAAVAVKRSDFVQKLLSNPDVNPNAPSPDGWSPLFTAQHLKLPEIERQLLDANAVEDVPTSSEPYPRPSRFHPQDRHVALHVSETGKEVTVGACPIDPYNTDEPHGAIRSDYPMNGIGFFYFEVTIKKGAAENVIGVGFCDEKAPLHHMLGWDEGSWGYHGDDGKTYGRGFGIEYGDVYSTGDTIGCYVNPSRGTAFYTINGKSLRQSPFLAFLPPLIYPPLIIPNAFD
ncbi:hypothetical protein N7537_003133 [Penicillium hordei]|uniref:B30.2/SPRY domain-containing protein n=1 Tax=Penicillium hordei TaxID=40994 RepID=A0AAD6H9F8_9EURO|nr:uncharacterized protein N7537_003133 [Penicillium hordei]KAJ5618019.1 hypothetical protein N7537_003133 [Penicillium hordei]